MSLIRSMLLASLLVLAVAGNAQAAPGIVTPPLVVGDPHLGGLLVAEQPELEDATPDDVTYSWQRSMEQGYVDIPGAHERTYAPGAADLGHRLRVRTVVETAAGIDEEWSEPTAAISYRTAAGAALTRTGADPGAPARLSRWRVTSGTTVTLAGRLGAGLIGAEARLVLEPTVATYDTVEAPVTIADDGGVVGAIEPIVNAVAWLEVTPTLAPTQRIRLGLVGVRPRIQLVLGAQRDGRDASGRALVRDLRILTGSLIAPHVAGLRLTWEGRLPGEPTGTAVCRTEERVTSGVQGRLHGGCRTRGAWGTARWRLVLDPGTANPAAAPFLPTTSAWVRPSIGDRTRPEVPNLPRSSATLRTWISTSSKS